MSGRYHSGISSDRLSHGLRESSISFDDCTEELGAESLAVSTGRSIVLHDNNVEVCLEEKSTHDIYVNNASFGSKEDSGYTLNCQQFSPKACFLAARNPVTEKKRFPPPIKSILANDTTVSLRSYKLNGRFVLVKVEISSPKQFRARRDGVRLRLERIAHDIQEHQEKCVKPQLSLEEHRHAGYIDKFPHAIDESQAVIDHTDCCQIVAAKFTAPNKCCINLLAAQFTDTPRINGKVLSIAKQVGPPCVH